MKTAIKEGGSIVLRRKEEGGNQNKKNNCRVGCKKKKPFF